MKTHRLTHAEIVKLNLDFDRILENPIRREDYLPLPPMPSLTAEQEAKMLQRICDMADRAIDYELDCLLDEAMELETRRDEERRRS